MPGYTVETPGDDVLIVRMDVDNAEWRQRFFLSADWHLDNPLCDKHLLRTHLDEARDTEAGVFVFGDMLDVMQAKQDRRHAKSSIGADLAADNYFNRVVNTTADFLEPYVDNMVMLSDGNHETAIRKHHEIDLLEFVAGKVGVPKMGYSGFVQFKFNRTYKHGDGNRTTRTLFFHHGSGGGGPVTKGVIRTNRQAVWLPDANIVVGGHIHEAWMVEVPRVRLTNGGRVYQDIQTHIQLATYKQEHTLAGGWHTERGAPPKPLGGYWMEFYHQNSAPGRIGTRFYRTN